MSGIVGTSHSKSGVIGRSLDTAKVLCQFDASGTSSVSPQAGSLNVSTIGYVASGRWTVNFSKSIGHDDYIANVTCLDSGGRNTTFYSTGTFQHDHCQVFITNMSQTGTTSSVVCFSAFGR